MNVRNSSFFTSQSLTLLFSFQFPPPPPPPDPMWNASRIELHRHDTTIVSMNNLSRQHSSSTGNQTIQLFICFWLAGSVALGHIPAQLPGAQRPRLFGRILHLLRTQGNNNHSIMTGCLTAARCCLWRQAGRRKRETKNFQKNKARDAAHGVSR